MGKLDYNNEALRKEIIIKSNCDVTCHKTIFSTFSCSNWLYIKWIVFHKIWFEFYLPDFNFSTADLRSSNLFKTKNWDL